jgi:hypothetical protein
MIAYRDLEHALARWKARRNAVGVEAPEITNVTLEAQVESAKPEAIEDTLTPLPPEHTGEIDLADAVVEDAR